MFRVNNRCPAKQANQNAKEMWLWVVGVNYINAVFANMVEKRDERLAEPMRVKPAKPRILDWNIRALGAKAIQTPQVWVHTMPTGPIDKPDDNALQSANIHGTHQVENSHVLTPNTITASY